MRLRKKWWAKNFIEDTDIAIVHNHGEDAFCKNNWESIFENKNEIHLEIGCGMGGFIKTISKKNPNINYVALDFKDEVIVNVVKKIQDESIKNVKLLVTKAEYLNEYFGEKEISRIYINFCNPWPKRTHAHRRLTHTNFLNIYKDILEEDGKIFFKTDYDDLFQKSLIYFLENRFEILYKTQDLTNSDYNQFEYGENIETEYEKKFIKKGKNINFVIAKK